MTQSVFQDAEGRRVKTSQYLRRGLTYFMIQIIQGHIQCLDGARAASHAEVHEL